MCICQPTRAAVAGSAHPRASCWTEIQHFSRRPCQGKRILLPLALPRLPLLTD
eukprot:COSAG06_NODE_3982_length_4690_cov_817.792420_7_plen_53_part_00